MCEGGSDFTEGRFILLFWLKPRWTLRSVPFIAVRLNEITFHGDLRYVWDSNWWIFGCENVFCALYSGCIQEGNLWCQLSTNEILPTKFDLNVRNVNVNARAAENDAFHYIPPSCFSFTLLLCSRKKNKQKKKQIHVWENVNVGVFYFSPSDLMISSSTLSTVRGESSRRSHALYNNVSLTLSAAHLSPHHIPYYALEKKKKRWSL